MLLNLELGAVNYYDNKVEGDKTLIFIHGNSHSLKTFKYQYEDKELSKYRIISYDLYGHGKSAKIKEYNIKNFANQLTQLITELNLNNIYLIGHSLGGHIAIQALKSLPKVQGIFIYGTPPLENPLTKAPFLDVAELGLLTNAELSTKDALQITQIFYEQKDKTFDFEIGDILNTDSDFRQNFLTSILKGDYEDEILALRQFNGSLQICLGINDRIISRDYLEDNFKDKLTIINNSAHNIHISNKEKFSTVLQQFINN